jgi:starvation-inducible DNA-binding protein
MKTLFNEMRGGSEGGLIKLLNSRLADALVLYTHAKQAHWNVKGSTFIALHKLFDDVADHAHAWADLLAEQVVMLEGKAEGVFPDVAKSVSLPAYSVKSGDATAHTKALADSLIAFAASIQSAAGVAEKVGDMKTNDLLLGMAQEVDKDVWFVKAHLE